MNKCLVLGGNGFIGSAIVRGLIDNNNQVCVIDRSDPNNKSLSDIVDKIEYIRSDFGSGDLLNNNTFENVSTIFHCITSTYPGDSSRNYINDIETNIIGTIRLLESFKQHYSNIRLVFLSSGGAIYGDTDSLPISEMHNTNPVSSYGISKLSIEKYLHMYKVLYGLDYLVFRISNPYGEFQNPNTGLGVITTFLHKILNGEVIEVWGDGNNVRDYIHVGDVVSAIISAAGKPTLNNYIYNIGSGSGKSINEILDIVRNITGKDIKVDYMDIRSSDVRSNYLDISRAKNDLGWNPTINIIDGISMLWDNIVNNKK